ncbi:MAG TPA: VWA domain-containing protein [Patescibacteria group bacterium]|nr:VWA domain-containing protein [Patescibacteria group bacterium]
MQRCSYPFAAIVGQENVKRALLVALVNPKAGGLLIAGEKGTGKSTLVRSLQPLLRERKIWELPLNASEDMVLGSLDMHYALETGKRRLLPGLMAKAHKQLLYIDEVNLLRRDFLSTLLEAANSGLYRVEREGLSCLQEAACTLLGTMNPEEGVLPVPILDRFGMYVQVSRETNEQARVEIVRRILDYEAEPQAFCQRYTAATEQLTEQLAMAQKLLPSVEVSPAMMLLAAQQCARVHAAGHRAELFLLEASRAIAALAGRSYLLPDDLEEAACYVLPQRLRQEQQEQPPEPQDRDDSGENEESTDQQSDQTPEQQSEPPPVPDATQESVSPDDQNNQNQREEQDNQGAGEENIADIERLFSFLHMELPNFPDRQERSGSGKRSLTRTAERQGRYVRAGFPHGTVTDLAFDATLRAAAPYQRYREHNGCALAIAKEDLRQKIREKRIGSTFLFVVDASGSMGARERMRAVKGAVCAMLQDAYQQRDQVGMIVFRRQSAEVLLPITRSVDLAQKCLRRLPTGGKTPLAEGLTTALRVLAGAKNKDSQSKPVIVLITDGRVNKSMDGKDALDEALKAAGKIRRTGVHSVVIDTEQDFIKMGLARNVAQEMGSSYYRLQELSEHNIMHIVKKVASG